ncbi:hypothetical protein ACERIM_16565 [Natrinema sp. H-ect1]|uniref:hypothetical protein n=1 Tax=Natrinema sp. H-ect1 TaxID=3242700 RepID=UPI00359E1E21
MTEDTHTDDSRIARRSVLTSFGVSAAVLAGCTSGSDPTTNTSDGNGISADGSDVFASVSIDDGRLEIDIDDGHSVEFVNLVGPDGELFDQQRLESGVTTTSFDILDRSDDLRSGEYDLVALDGDEDIGSTTITLEAACTITDVLWAAANPEMDWDTSSPNWETYAAVVIENRGTIPAVLTELRWAGAPVARLQSKDSQSYYHETRLPPGETTVYSRRPVYRTENALGSVDCTAIDVEPMTVTAVVNPGKSPSYTQQIRYGGSQSCELSIVEGDPDEPISVGGEN